MSQSRRDADLDDTDSIQILLDTFNDGQNAFVFGTNPFGIEYDGQVEGRRPVRTAGETAGRLQPELGRRLDGPRADDRARLGGGVRHPAQDAAVQPGPGANVGRQRRSATSGARTSRCFSSPVPRGYELTRVSVAGKLNGLEPARRAATSSSLPYVAGAVNDEQDTSHRHGRSRTGDVGLDVKWGVRAESDARLTVNTDFAQVEADEQQVNLTRFPLFFPEKRPFFLENAQLFEIGPAPGTSICSSRGGSGCRRPASRSTSSRAGD